MADGLTIIDSFELIGTSGTNAVGDIFNPLHHRIFLLDTDICGTGFIEEKERFEALEEEQELILMREPDNDYDEYAILVLNQKQEKLGYLPRKSNRILARLMDGGKVLMAKITDADLTYNYPLISVDVFMIDF